MGLVEMQQFKRVGALSFSFLGIHRKTVSDGGVELQVHLHGNRSPFELIPIAALIELV